MRFRFHRVLRAPYTKDLLVDSLFQEALVWTVGGSTTADGRLRFDAFLRELCSGKTPDGYVSPSGRATVGFELPSQGEPGPSEHTVSAAIARSVEPSTIAGYWRSSQSGASERSTSALSP